MATENSVFTKKHEEVMANDKRAILEEMNLPPAVITFIRKNAKNLKIGIVVFIIGVIAWEGYGEYSQRQQEKSSALLFSAVKAETTAEKSMLLEDLIKNFSGSKSAVWGKLELGHLAFQEKNYQGAADKYQEVLNSISASNSLYPLAEFSLAQAYESLEESAKSEAAYEKLLKYPGFAAEGYLGLGSLYEKKGDEAKALEMYESYINLPGLKTDSAKTMVEYKIGKLKNSK